MIDYIGTSGFQYDRWIGPGEFFPTKKDRSLEFYAKKLNSLELNATFYRIPTLKICESWFRRSPDDFSFIVKAPRLITHTYRLNEKIPDIVDWFGNVMEGLQYKLKCVLWQFPPSFQFNDTNFERTKRFCDTIANRFPVSAFEYRHYSWCNEKITELLADRRFEYVRSDHADYNCMDILETVSPFNYIRLHGPKGNCRGTYSNQRLAEIVDAYLNKDMGIVQFNNDIDGYAPFNAMTIQDIINNKNTLKTLG